MPIQVQGPDGQIIEFPEGTPDTVMENAMREFYGGPARADFSQAQGSADTKAADGWEPGLARDVAMGGRSTLQGIGGMLGLATDPLARMTGLPTGRDGASALADKLGLPKPQTSRERVIGDMGEAISGTGVTMGVGAGLRGGGAVADKLGRFLTAQPGLQAVSAGGGSGAASSVRERGGSPLAQAGAGLVGGIAPGALSTAAAGATRGLVRGRSGADMRRTIDDFAGLGATPSVGQASGNRILQGAENLLAGGPTSAGVMGRFVERQADDIGKGLATKADDLYRNSSAERAGRAVERGVGAFAKGVKGKRSTLYDAADAAIPPTVETPLTNTRQALAELTALTPGAESTSAALVNPRIAGIASTVGEDFMAAQAQGKAGIPYAALTKLRSRIGEELSESVLSPDRPTAQYKRLYAAMSQDMEDVARQQGPVAMRAAKRANTYMRASADRLEQVERVVSKAGGPEKVYTATMAGTRDGGTTLRSVMQSLDKEGQQAVTGAVIKRMGLPTPGQAGIGADEFSASTFLTNWNRVSPEAKRALFDRHGLGFSRDMDRIASVANNIKSGAKVFANPSGTANRAAALTYGASLVASLFDGSGVSMGALIGSGAGANVMARWMTNPDIVRALARTTAAPKGAVPGIVSTLNVQAQKTGDADLAELARLIEEANENGGNRE